MKSNSFNRRSIRLPEYDYSLPGEYYVTSCIHNRECLLGDVADEQMILNDFGLSVKKFWLALPSHYKNLSLGEWVIMPNHMHGIIIIHDLIPVGAIHESPLQESNHGLSIQESPLKNQRRQMLLFKAVGRFKMNSSKEINSIRNTQGQPVWQRNYFEHIIRDGQSYTNIEHYIRTNPSNWRTDVENPDYIKNKNNQNSNSKLLQ